MRDMGVARRRDPVRHCARVAGTCSATFDAAASLRAHRSGWLAVALPMILLGLTVQSAVGATIFVTTTTQKISESGGCSLQEALYSANLDDNIAVVSVDVNGNEVSVRTECVPGSGDDTIVLP